MSVDKRDNYTGHLTTGHEWNGISELNTRVPRILLFFLAATIVFSIGYWYFMPAWPGRDDYSRGKLGIDQRDIVESQLHTASAMQTIWSDRLSESSLNDVADNDELMQIVAKSGPALYSDNCGMCHGQSGEGRRNFPRLNDAQWLWGGSPEDILKTLKNGINAPVDGTRIANMPAFGINSVLDVAAIDQVASYVLSMSNDAIGDGSKVNELTAVRKGEAVYRQHCSACHGVDAKGNSALGAPNLTDSFWIYGAEKESVIQSIHAGRAGHMPAWKDRLSDIQLRLLSLYVAELSNDNTSVEQ